MICSEMAGNKNKYNLLCLVFLIFLITGGCEDLLTDLGNGDLRDKITGSWLCDESEGYLKSVEETYHVEIFLDPDDSTKVLIFNFFNLDPDISAEAILSGSRLILPSQTLEGGFTISGSGLIAKSNTRIDWEYSVNDGSGKNYELTAVYTK
jgi:hypothetical protein